MYQDLTSALSGMNQQLGRSHNRARQASQSMSAHMTAQIHKLAKPIYLLDWTPTDKPALFRMMLWDLSASSDPGPCLQTTAESNR